MEKLVFVSFPGFVPGFITCRHFCEKTSGVCELLLCALLYHLGLKCVYLVNMCFEPREKPSKICLTKPRNRCECRINCERLLKEPLKLASKQTLHRQQQSREPRQMASVRAAKKQTICRLDMMYSLCSIAPRVLHFSDLVIDCFEVFMERPKGLMARAQTWSNYKHHNTIKFLIGISPQGSITYVSKGCRAVARNFGGGGGGQET